MALFVDYSDTRNPEMDVEGEYAVADAISKRSYKYILRRLRSDEQGPLIANERGVAGTTMTGLEYAVYKKDWKMVAIFLTVGGADPKDNVFDAHPKFGECVVVPGFDGLDLLVDDDDDKGRAYMWLLRRMHERGCIVQDMREIMERLDVVSKDMLFTGAECMGNVFHTIMCMRRLGLSNDIAMRIAEESIFVEVWHRLNEFALRGVDSIWKDILNLLLMI